MRQKKDKRVREYRYIVVEGPIGVGKTLLAHLLQEEIKGRLITERVEDNPFLSKFYKNPREFAFQTQIFFLLSRYRQQEELTQLNLFEKTTICDYLFAKERIFAYLNLDDSELALYEEIYSLLNPKIPQPDLVIYLQAETDVLIQRIRQRGREYEREISRIYIDEVNEAYNRFFFHYSESPLLVIQTTEIDFNKDRDLLHDIIKRIENMKGQTQYYVVKKIIEG